jgi:dTDP-4-dehydrorhamnose reductase
MLAQALLPALAAAGHEPLAPPESEADVTDEAALQRAFGAFRPEWVFHLAAITQVDRCESEPERAFAVNAEGSRHVARVAAALGAALLAVSTDYVFDGRGTRPYREDDPADPASVYGRSKWAGEVAVRETTPRHLIVRTAWLYGRGGANFPDAILAKARAGGPLAVVDDQRGSPTWSRDLAPMLIALAERAPHGTYHCTSGGDCTWHEFAAHLVARAGLAVPVARTSTAALGRPAPRPAYSVLDTSKTEAATGRRMPHWKDAADHYLAELGVDPAPTGPRRDPS